MSDYIEDGEPHDRRWHLSNAIEAQRWGPKGSGANGKTHHVHTMRMHEPSGNDGNEHDAGRFKWETADTTNGPVLNSLWLVKGVLPRHGTGAIFGRAGSGKTFSGRTLACISRPEFHGAGTRSSS